MRHRVALARTLMNEPELLVMDEPFAALDSQTRETMQALLLDIWQRHRSTVLFVTHDIEEGLLLADRVVVLSRRPARIVSIIEVDIPRPREYATVLTPEFIALRARLRELLHSSPRRSTRAEVRVTDPHTPSSPSRDALPLHGAAPMEPILAPEGAPNVLVVLIDDMGFGAPSAFGGPCRMPTADRLAADGLRYSRFHVTALCSPTRQALLTGRNHHSVGMGTIAEMATAAPGYTSVRPLSAATIAQILRGNGYKTAAFGKMHQTPTWESGPMGPFDRWPTGDGFEKFYGFMGAEMNHWQPLLYDGTRQLPPRSEQGDGYHLSEDLVDQAISWLRTQQALAPQHPFFVYLPFGATHAPHHVAAEWRDRYARRL